MTRPQLSEEQLKKYGQPLKFDPEFHGPTKRRSCTDILCLILFLVFIVICIGIAAYAFRFGDPKKLASAVDSDGKKCGVDSEVLDKHYLLFFNLAKCATSKVLLTGCDTPQICVKQCPTHSWAAFPYFYNDTKFDLQDIQRNLLCKDDSIKNSVTNREVLRARINDGLCAEWYLRSTAVYKRCLPISEDLNSGKDWLLQLGLLSDSSVLLESARSVQTLTNANEFGSMLIQDMVNTWPYIIAGVVASAALSLIAIILLRWIACVVTWLTLIILIVLLGVGSFLSYKQFERLSKNGPVENNKKMLEGQWEEIKNSKALWMFFCVALAVIGLILLILVIFLRKRIQIAITLIKEGSKAVGSIISTLFFPIIPWILHAIVIMWVVAVGVFLASIRNQIFKAYGMTSGCMCEGNYKDLKDGDICDPVMFQKQCHMLNGSPCLSAGCRYFGHEVTTVSIILQLINVFGGFWGVWFVSGVCYMIMASTFATWYWTWDKRKLPFFTLTYASYRTVRYHLGTVAFGSLIISICSFIRALLEYTEKKLKSFENIVAKALFCCLRCFFWCLEQFLRFISRNAYIMCAIHGKNFCVSAKDAFNLLMRNVIRVVVLDKVTDFLFFIGKLSVTALVVGGAYLFVFRHPVVQVNYLWLPLIIIAISAYFVSTIFFGVYAMAVDTLFLCFLEDCERNDGSPEKPYFMSKSLMQVLGKRNKRP